MSDPYIGEIRMFGGNFPPNGWAFCDGQQLSIQDNETLFQLLGTTYGGDGQSTFALPNLQGRVPVHSGTGAGQTVTLGQSGGQENVTLNTNALPSHNHPLQASGTAGDASVATASSELATMGPAGNVGTNIYVTYDGSAQVNLAPTSIGGTGGNQPHANIQPTLAINYILSLYGVYPSPN